MLDVRNRTGTNTAKTLQDLELEKHPLFGAALDRIEQLTRVQNELAQAILEGAKAQNLTTNDHRVLTFDTNAAPLTNDQGQKIDVFDMFGGYHGRDLYVQSVGGGNLQININGRGWIPVSAGDTVDKHLIRTLEVRTTSGALGTARFVVFARVGYP